MLVNKLFGLRSDLPTERRFERRRKAQCTANAIAIAIDVELPRSFSIRSRPTEEARIGT
jgi:hypothetical protein